jgi:hypothetical protein
MKFSELAVGDKFTFNGTEYVKTETVKVSCCKSVNCMKTADNSKTMVNPDSAVEQVNA